MKLPLRDNWFEKSQNSTFLIHHKINSHVLDKYTCGLNSPISANVIIIISGLNGS